MTAQEVYQYFQYHNSNLQSLKVGFEEIRNQIKALYLIQKEDGTLVYAIAGSNPDKIKAQEKEVALSRILSGIQVSIAEECLKRLLYEHNLFSDIQRNNILSIKALDQKWYKTLLITFCIAYNLVPNGDPECKTVNIKNKKNQLGNDLVSKYFVLREVITKYLIPNFTIRNKVQHGEWKYAFDSGSQNLSSDLTLKVNHENIVTTTSRYTLLNSFYNMLVDLGRFRSNTFAIDSSTTPFEYFYDSYIEKINFEKNKIINPELENYISSIVVKKQRGESYKRQNALRS